MHFNGACSLEHLSVQPIEIIYGNGRDEKPTKQRKLREAFWIKELRQRIHTDLTIIAMDKTGLTEMTMILHPRYLIKPK